MKTRDRQNRKFILSTFQTLEICCVKQIIYIEALENYCKVHYVNGAVHIATQSFGSINSQLLDLGFFQSHKSYTVNFTHVGRYHRSGEIELINGAKVPLARRRKEEFMQRLNDWCAEESECSYILEPLTEAEAASDTP